MLTQLAIQDYAIVDRLELDLTRGMTAITRKLGQANRFYSVPLAYVWVSVPTLAACAMGVNAPTFPLVLIFNTCPLPLSG